MQNKIKTFSGIDYNYRPVSDFSTLDEVEHLLLKNIRGEFRRREIKKAIKHGTYETIPVAIRRERLDDAVRDQLINLNPLFTGGEYLPDYLPHETEIARIIVKCGTLDIVSIRARPKEGKIYYRIVDEYDSEISVLCMTSKVPLSLLELIELICVKNILDSDYDLPWEFIRVHIGCMDETDDPYILREFVEVDSIYYSSLWDHYSKEIDELFPYWIDKWKSNNKVGG
jgi:hypothetical protein